MKSKAALLALALLAMPQELFAQPPGATRVTNVPACHDSTSTRYRRRLRIDLAYTGANAREMWDAIEFAASNAAVCVTSGSEVPAPDTSVYGQIRINALDGGGYEVATGLSGPLAPRRPRPGCQSGRAAIVGGDKPVLWGVILAGAVRRFVACALAARDSTGALKAPPSLHDR